MAESAPIRVVTVFYNSASVLPRFLESVRDATDGSLEVVVVDNASPTPPEIAQPGVSIRTAEQNLGYGGGANLGASGAEGEWLVIANPDIVWRPGALDTLLEHAENWPDSAVFGPQVLEPDGSRYPSARRFPSVTTGAGHALLSRLWPNNPFSRSYRNDAIAAGSDRLTDWLSGSCLVIRREAFESVGGFDESYFMFFEDVDLCWRLAERGLTSVYVPAATVYHDQGHSWRSQPADMLRAHHASAYQYLRARYPGRLYLPVRMAARLGLAIRLRWQLFASSRGKATGA